jgi:predicted 2-oxoglutarate/Fe(II)-dependent dioxygenase YbiX
MDKLILAPGIVVYKNILPGSMKMINTIETDCDSWTDGAIAQSRLTETYEAAATIDKKIRDVDVKPILRKEDKEFYYCKTIDKAISNKFNETFLELEKDYMSHYSISIAGIHSNYQILKYKNGQFFANHVDSQPGFERTLSMTYYFNDDYLGGELYFDQFDLTFKPTAGDFLIFPSMWVYSHSANPVTSGTKYAVVSFLK